MVNNLLVKGTWQKQDLALGVKDKHMLFLDELEKESRVFYVTDHFWIGCNIYLGLIKSKQHTSSCEVVTRVALLPSSTEFCRVLN